MQTVGSEAARRLAGAPVFVYSLTVFVSASLVFWVQPLAVRGLLPAVGGAPLLWNTAMLFFQGALLLGYLLGHLLHQRASRRGQLAVLGLLWAVALLAAWTGGAGSWLGATPPQGGGTSSVLLPALWLLGTLAVSYGPGCLAVSTLTPLVSAWLSRAGTERDPYALYAVSNAGSIGILMVYPFLLEPLFGVAWQLRAWHVVFALLFVLVAWLGVRHAGSGEAPGSESAREPATAQGGVLTRRACVKVVLLSLLTSALLYGVTLRLSSDVVATPLLWVLPLALYLGTWALAFGRRQVFGRWREALSCGPFPGALILFALWHGLGDRSLWTGVLHLGVFGLAAFYLHGLLWEKRPSAGDPGPGPGQALTRFYVLIAGGGLLGGALSVLVFPLLLADVWEYPVLFALAALLLPRGGGLGRGEWFHAFLSVGVAVAATFFLCVPGGAGWLRVAAVGVLVVSVPGLWALRHRPRVLSAALLLVSLTPAFAWTVRGGEVVARERTWFGIYRVMDMTREGLAGRVRLFFHGVTLQGMAWQRAGGTVEDRVGYYTPESPHGDVMRALRRREGSLRLGLVGLGVGSLLCYAEPGDTLRVWEIDAAVESLARSHFRALEDCGPEAEIVVGDGRLEIRKEAPGSFEALFLDSFSSASIPVHLLTVEAFGDYLRVLAPGGVLAVHISNRHLALERLVSLVAAELGLAGMVRRDKTRPWSPEGSLPLPTHLAVLAREASVIEALGLGEGWEVLEPEAPTWWRRAWTDDRSSIVPYLHW